MPHTRSALFFFCHVVYVQAVRLCVHACATTRSMREQQDYKTCKWSETLLCLHTVHLAGLQLVVQPGVIRGCSLGSSNPKMICLPCPKLVCTCFVQPAGMIAVHDCSTLSYSEPNKQVVLLIEDSMLHSVRPACMSAFPACLCAC